MSKFTIFLLLVFSLQAATADKKRYSREDGPVAVGNGLTPRAAAREFLLKAAAEMSITPEGVRGAYVAKEYQTEHNGVTHFLYRQRFSGMRVLGAAWSINVDRDGNILNAGGMLYNPPTNVASPSDTSALTAVRAAVAAVNPRLGARFTPVASAEKPSRDGARRFAGLALPEDIEGEPVWIPVRGVLNAGWVFVVTDEAGIDRYQVATTTEGAVLSRRNLTRHQNPKGLVFDKESPQPNPKPGVLLTVAPSIVDRVNASFVGDPVASPNGWVVNNETRGNNTITGRNPLGTTLLINPTVTKAESGDFSFPLQIGPSAAAPTLYPDAVTTNLFYWTNRAHDFFYQIGFNEAAGNFQQENFGKGGVSGDPMYAYSQFSSARPSSPQLNNAFFTTLSDDDGARSGIHMFVATSGRGGFFTDGSLDSVVIVHEYTHGVSTRLVADGYATFQGTAMGEAWSDFMAMELLTPPGAPVDGVYPAGEYFTQAWGVGIRTRPYSTNIEVNPLTFADMSRVLGVPEEHSDGEIWVQALWEMRANLIAQFGEAEGRRRARLLVIDGMKLATAAPSMVDARDAILLADRVDFNGASQTQIWRAFAKRGLGTLAYTPSGDSIYVIPSFDVPSSAGVVKLGGNPIVAGELVRVFLADGNLTGPQVKVELTSGSGDFESLTLVRDGSLYVGSIPTSQNSVARENGTLNVGAGDTMSVFYNDVDAGGGQFKQAFDVVNAILPYTYRTEANSGLSFPGETPLNIDSTGTGRVDLPFDFPFFGDKFRSVLVGSDGYFSFGLDQSLTCPDAAGLRSVNGGSPMWTATRVDGAAQPGEGIYVSRTRNSVTVRWAAETIPFVGPASPLNFAATFVDDGTILYRYGSNPNPGSALTYAGCGRAPVIGIGNGRESYSFVLASSSFDNLVTIRMEPPFGFSSFPNARLERPAADEKAQGVLTVSGVAWDDTASIRRVDIVVDDRQVGQASYGAARPDFCATQNVRGCPNVGFTSILNLDALGIQPGAHKLRLRVTTTRGAFLDFPAAGPVNFSVDAGFGAPPVVAIESPAANAEVTGTLAVRGWAHANTLRVAGIDVLIDGITYPGGAYGVARTDICNNLNPRPASCPAIGFQANINTRVGTPPLPDGEHGLQIRVRDEAGRLTVLPATPVKFTVKNGAYQAPVGLIAAPALNARLQGTVTVAGFAYAPGSNVAQVGFFVNLEQQTGIRTAVVTAAECRTLGAPDGRCTRWEYDLDTRRFANGPYNLAALVVNQRGDFVFVPNDQGLNVVIDNR